MRIKYLVSSAGVALCCLAATAARCDDGRFTIDVSASGGTITARQLAQVLPGMSTKAQVQALLGTPWRIVQFNDCGHAMPGQEDETWDYRGKDSKGTYRVHIEFDDRNVATLVAKIPDHVPGGKGTTARTAPSDPKLAMKM
jgi:outer membrane protein assembly factor BamE (lipoprotein component of BamABCDE complex)